MIKCNGNVNIVFCDLYMSPTLQLLVQVRDLVRGNSSSRASSTSNDGDRLLEDVRIRVVERRLERVGKSD